MIEGYVTFSPGVANIFWKPQNGSAPIFRSEAPHDGFEKITDIELNTGHYIDEFNIVENKFFYYRIGGVLMHMFQIPNAYAREIIRRDNWFLRSWRHSGGTYGYVLIRKTDGEHCDCWDEIHQKPTRSNCPTCYGTGIKDPYYKPLKIYFDFRASKNMTRPLNNRTSTEGYNQAMWMTNKPLLKPNDIIVFQGIRYRVGNNITYSRMGEYITKQFVPLEAIERNRPEYKIPIPPPIMNEAYIDNNNINNLMVEDSELELMLNLILKQYDNVVDYEVVESNPDISLLGPGETTNLTIPFLKEGILQNVYISTFETEAEYNVNIYDSPGGILEYSSTGNKNICYDVIDLIYIDETGGKNIYIIVENLSNFTINFNEFRIRGIKFI